MRRKTQNRWKREMDYDVKKLYNAGPTFSSYARISEKCYDNYNYNTNEMHL